jgi:hypothetical protein
MLPGRAVQIINEYSKPLTRSDWRKSKSVFIKPNDEVDELTIHVHVVTILIILFNIVIYINALFILSIIIGIGVCIYRSI